MGQTTILALVVIVIILLVIWRLLERQPAEGGSSRREVDARRAEAAEAARRRATETPAAEPAPAEPATPPPPSDMPQAEPEPEPTGVPLQPPQLTVPEDMLADTAPDIPQAEPESAPTGVPLQPPQFALPDDMLADTAPDIPQAEPEPAPTGVPLQPPQLAVPDDMLADLSPEPEPDPLPVLEEFTEEAALPPAPEPEPAPAEPEPAPAADLSDPLADDVDPQAWLESLARRQGANVEEFTTDADLEVPEVSPDTFIDEPGYTPYDISGGGMSYSSPEPAAPSADAVAPSAEEASTGAVDPEAWLQSLAAEQAALDDTQSGFAAEPVSAADEDDLIPADMPDWLTEELPAVDANAARDWLDQHETGSMAVPDAPPAAEVTDDMPDWLTEAIPTTPQQPAPAAPPPVAPPPLTTTHCCAFYPRAVQPQTWQPMHAYLFKATAGGAVAADARTVLANRPNYGESRQPLRQAVPEGALITATPQVAGFQFNPPSLSLYFLKDWHRFDFDLRATEQATVGASHAGTVTFMVEGVIVADVPLLITVRDTVAQVEIASQTARPYQAVFCSYSHHDTQIAEKVEQASRWFGFEYLRDVVSLKSGQHWSEEIYDLIDRADIFQLFWSAHAAQSPYVEQEWRRALQLVAAQRKDAHFIRPLRWTEPIQPVPPPDLQHIHFDYRPELSEGGA